jgi:hypothetical protein
MSTITFRLRTRLLSVAVLALFAAGCGGETARQAAPARKATPPPTSAAPSPTSPDTQPMTTSELIWLHAVERLLPAMNKVFTGSPTDLSPAALTTLASQASGCRRELTRIGPASARLQPVEALVEQACTEYDKGAACFAAAARAAVSSSAASFSELEKQINCGFAVAATGGGPLAEARIVAENIKDATG